MDLVGHLLQLKKIFIGLVQYGFPAIALILSYLSYRDSRKANRLRERLHEVEERLKKYELEEKEKEREEATRACVEARIYNVARHNFRMKIWNSGKATAYNVDFEIAEEYRGYVRREMVPYEFLDPGKSFEEYVMVHSGTPNKFIVTTTWTDKQGESYSKEQIVTI
ncbi:hypothetical protein CN481_00245 [Bacillus sp. AFS006103]|nr:hypothetical protein CN481_00245 [Bacillus sp. AFS006103]